MVTRTEARLDNFCIYNPTWGPREGQEENKILYYYPHNVDIDTKIKNVGLCEAVIKFAETFSTKPCEAIHTQKARQVVFEPEKDFFMVITIGLPYTQKIKDGQTYNEYHEDDIKDKVCMAVLRQAYKMFCLFMGTFQHILDKGPKLTLNMRLEHFYSRYLLTIRFEQCDVLDVFSGLSFLPLDKNMFLRIQCLMNLLEASFKRVKYTIFLYSDQLVWSGLEQDDIRIMYKYLVTSLFPNHLEQEFVNSTASSGVPNSTHGASYGKFVTGPPSLQDPSNLGKVPRVFLNKISQNEECFLVVYKALSASVCLLIDTKQGNLEFEFFRSLHKFLEQRLSQLASDMSEQYSRRISVGDPVYKYIYFNHMNLAQKTTIHIDPRKGAGVNIPTSVLHFLSDMNTDFSNLGEDGETIIKTCTDYWIVGKRSDQREFYVVINSKSANLIEINEEVKKLCETHFNNIFFLD